MRDMILVLGDQLDANASILNNADPGQDTIWMAEVQEEASHVWSHKTRLVLFFAAMRHFRDLLRSRGLDVRYHALTEQKSQDRGSSLADVLRADIRAHQPQRLVVTRPGDYRVLCSIQQVAKDTNISLHIAEDTHFLTTPEAYAAFAKGRKRILLENFYHHMRRETGLLMDDQGKPLGGRWNFDKDNRRPLTRSVLDRIPRPPSFPPDQVTGEVINLISKRFADHPGRCTDFDHPVTQDQARQALSNFITHRLPDFGAYEDAMHQGEPVLFHSRLSACLNLKLLHPQECLDAALDALRHNAAPLNSVEGFVRQIIGWREYIRGVYWLHMPDYQDMNALDHQRPIPSLFWDGLTDMACLRDAMANVLRLAYTHHIQRLMVLGLFALLAGVHPRRFHEWHMAMYADAVDWVSLPNALGMSQYADGGIVGTKPYCATGKYIQRMGDCCPACAFDPAQSYGPRACPFSVLYWDFLGRHAQRLGTNQRMTLQLANLERRRQDKTLMNRTRKAAQEIRKRYWE
ncbi:cryptochrome/photolyase family protein [Desulfonatronum thioautotrophicum]|uniref:cryptochrome/photolyase family protein n=1 Tax=Desulfonatronum thioautotrophicum TaxID=617001 RepID=UPI0005EBB5BB|nr:cryptochrome/photolyase family protein [Desulfonatronum thioautotrophicum]